MDQRIRVRAKTIKLLEENTGLKPSDLRPGSSFVDLKAKAHPTKENRDK
jgi:hypothetical protein